MSASITSGTYGRQPAFAFGGAFRQLVAGLFSTNDRPAVAAPRAADRRLRIREANDVRALARSVEEQSPGFAADLYAAASRHEGLDD